MLPEVVATLCLLLVNLGNGFIIPYSSMDKKSYCRKDQLGTGYEGAVNTTRNGTACVKWNSVNQSDNFGWLGSINYCRNPNATRTQPWCFTADGEWDYCDIPLCDCPAVSCKNAGTIDLKTCTCLCNKGFRGLFCETRVIETSWPSGSYAVPASLFGCPEDDAHGWSVGYVNMTQTSAKKHSWSDSESFTFEPHILGPFTTETIQLNFCTMKATTENRNRTWPPGEYCIYRVGGSCPGGFHDGNLTIRGYSIDTGGDLPDVTIYNSSEFTVYFCCRQDGNSNSSIDLQDFPFILFLGPTSNQCQEVAGMEVDMDLFYLVEVSKFSFDGLTPNFSKHQTLADRISLPFCFYKPFQRRECMYAVDAGASYNGRVNVTTSGKACELWENYKDYTTSTRWVGEFEYNYCRKFSNTYRPGCPVGNTIELCDIPFCVDDDADFHIFGEGRGYNSAPTVDSSPASAAVDGLIGHGISMLASRPYSKPWLLVNLQEYIEVHAIILHRRSAWFPRNHRYLGTYVSKHRWDFITYGAYRCDYNRNPRTSKVFRYQCHRPIVGQYVSVKNFDVTDPGHRHGSYYYLEIEEIQIIGKYTYCGRQLGLIDGNVFDYQLEGSSFKDANHLPQFGRLYSPSNGWCANPGDSEPWFMVDFIVDLRIQGLEIQSSTPGTHQVASFMIMYGNHRNKLTWYEDPVGTQKVFILDELISPTSVQRFVLNRDIYARYLKLVPKEFTEACVKLEVIGCPKQFGRDLFCRNPMLDYGLEGVKAHKFWMDENHDIERMSKNDVTSLECMESCRNISCLSYTYSAGQKSCYMHYGHKYNVDHTKWWTGGHSADDVSYHRLCFKDIGEINKCGGEIKLKVNESSTIHSPGFPLLYGQGLNCTWSIKSDKYILIEVGSLELQPSVENTVLNKIGVYDVNVGLCQDTLFIEDSSGISTKFQPNKKVHKGQRLISKSGNINLRLSSCFQFGQTDRKAFEIQVSVIDFPGCGTLDSCFQTCTDQSAYILTPGFPAGYEAGETCFWRIKGVYGQFVSFNIIELDINGGESCSQSFLAVYDVDRNDKSIVIGKYCKENRRYQEIISSWHQLHIEFRSSSESLVAGGFLGKYNLETFIQESIQEQIQQCPFGWYGYRDSCYAVKRRVNGLSWIDAEKTCRTLFNSSLVSIVDSFEMKFVHYLITVLDSIADERAYIGLKKKSNGYTMDDYIWSDGSTVTFTAWYHDEIEGTSQPDGLQNEKCSIIKLFSIHNMNDWHDVACAYDKIPNFICETSISSASNTTNTTANREIVTDLNVTIDKETYHCASGEYILSAFVCDGIDDCVSRDDEYNCSIVCSGDQFTCDDGTCISISLHCDFIEHCTDGSDENSCERLPCTDDEWQCGNKQCIPIEQRCDFVQSCYDHSDEDNCETCGPNSFQCYDATCIPKSRVCDGFVDCNGLFREDEGENCQFKTQPSCADWWKIGLQNNGEYLVGQYLNESARVECRFNQEGDTVRVSTVVHHDSEELLIATDDTLDINPQYDVIDHQISRLMDASNCSQSIELYCYFIDRDVIRESVTTKVTSKSSTDKCSCPFVGSCQANQTRCNCGTNFYDWYTADYNEIRSDTGIITNKAEIPVRHLYAVGGSIKKKFVRIRLGPLVCQEDIAVSFSILRCRGGQTFPSKIKCILEFDNLNEIVGCRDLSHLTECETFSCPTGYYKCQDSYCVPPNLLCDGVNHCPNQDDEQNCEKPLCDGLFRCQKSSKCISMNKRCDGNFDCPFYDDELLCDAVCPSHCRCQAYSSICSINHLIHNLTIPLYTRKIDYHLSNLSTYNIDISRNIFLAEVNLSNTQIHDLAQINFGDSQHNIYLLDLTYNLLSVIPYMAFQSLTHLKTLLLNGNVLLSKLEMNAFNGLSILPALEIKETNLKELLVSSFHGLEHLKYLNLSHNKLYSVDDGSFTGLKSLKTLDIRYNQIQEFTKDIFLGLDNLEEIFSDAYVFCCLRPTSVKDENCLPQRDEFSSCEDMMRNDFLRVCLWVIGLCALFGNSVVIGYRIIFDRTSLSKGHGIFITSLGIADLTMGIYMLTIASADAMFRGNYVWNDLSWRYGPVCKFAGILSTFASECSVMFLFFITIDRFIAIRFTFGQIRFNKKLALITSVLIFILCLVIAILPVVPNDYFDGDFYSRSAVCLALPLTREKTNGWQYSFGIFIILNFIIFLTIASLQLVIYREVKSTMRGVRSTKKKQDLTIARSLFLVVFSDFLCWFPVGVMGLMALTGHSIPGEVYALTAVFILPINSALNPFLYTFSAIIRTRRESLRRRSFNSNEMKPKLADRTTSVSVLSDIQSVKSLDDLNDILDRMLIREDLQTTDIDSVIAKLSKAKETQEKKSSNGVGSND